MEIKNFMVIDSVKYDNKTTNRGNSMNYNIYSNQNFRTYSNFKKENNMKNTPLRNTPNTVAYRCPIILVLDTSHTMWGKGQLETANFLQTFYGELAKKSRLSNAIDIAAVSMGDNLGMLEEFTPFKNSSLPRVNIRPKGDTPLGRALNLALRKLEAQENHYKKLGIKCVAPQMIIFSDGNSSDDYSFAANRMQNLAAAGKLKCYTIAIGNFPNMRTLYQLGHNLNVPGIPASQAFYNVTQEVCRHYAANAPKLQAKPFAPACNQHSVEYVIDGTNILHSRYPQAALARVLALVVEFTKRSIPFCVFFDASAKHHLSTKLEKDIYRRLINTDLDRFVEVPCGTDADDYILAYAKDNPRRIIITLDRYKEYKNKYGVTTKRVVRCVCVKDDLLLPDIGMTISVPNIIND